MKTPCRCTIIEGREYICGHCFRRNLDTIKRLNDICFEYVMKKIDAENAIEQVVRRMTWHSDGVLGAREK